MISDTELGIGDKDALEFLERMLIKHKVVRDLLDKMFMEQDQRGDTVSVESDETNGSRATKH
jgi:hypothetical protein